MSAVLKKKLKRKFQGQKRCLPGRKTPMHKEMRWKWRGCIYLRTAVLHTARDSCDQVVRDENGNLGKVLSTEGPELPAKNSRIVLVAREHFLKYFKSRRVLIKIVNKCDWTFLGWGGEFWTQCQRSPGWSLRTKPKTIWPSMYRTRVYPKLIW